jgi:DNA processing protein
MARVDAELAAANAVGARLVTVLDAHYPANLRLIPNLPPFLFYRGEVKDEDVRSVAVVGTRDASEDGIQRARRMSALLAKRGVTVISGLAKGIDTAAHRAALDAGGRTIAVLGTGITKCYPSENHGLAEEIATQGALVSQFWPTRSPGKDTFPRRNVVTSGLSQGTVVIEATRTSGAKMQARLALEHGKKVFLIRSLVTDQKWAKDYVLKRGAIEVGDVGEVIRYLASPERVRQASEQRQQLQLALL